MTLADLEQAAEDQAWSHLDLRGHLPSINGYASHQTPKAKLTIQHRKGPERKRGQRRYTLNGIVVSRHRAASLLEV